MSEDFLTTDEVNLIKSDVHDFVYDPEIGIEITYKIYTGKTGFSKTVRTVTPTFTSVTIQALRFPLDNAEIVKSDGHYQSGDYKYLIQITDIDNPKKDDRIVDDG